MFSLVIRGFLQRKLRVLLTGVAIALGVALMAGLREGLLLDLAPPVERRQMRPRARGVSADQLGADLHQVGDVARELLGITQVGGTESVNAKQLDVL